MARHQSPSQSNLRWLADGLLAGGYSAEAVRQQLGIRHPDDIGALNHAPAVERLRGDRSATATLTRLWFLETTELQRTVDKALGTDACERLIGIGLLRRCSAGRVVARLRIEAVDQQYFLADRRFLGVDRTALHLSGRDPVYPPSSDSFLLREIIPMNGDPSVLDLCCGSGVQALTFATRASRLAGVDLNPRAVAIAELNAGLNGVDRFDVRCGDLYAPLHREQFDVILANPPFVSSPYERGPAYHAGGASGDRILRRIIKGYSKHLAPQGRAFAISHVGLRRGETMTGVAAKWFADFPGRALIVTLESGSRVDLAAAQAQFAFERGRRAYAAEVRRWVDYLRRHRIDSIVAFLAVAERNGTNSIEVVDGSPRILPLPLTPSASQRVADWLLKK
ncbi:MAG: class I SAM-dependent methyltransferase [Deltaproteobacteria bacterium]|nr:class I SAM-dependent methyltransferase [Deltaproteobacteria bacterium]